MGQKCGTGYDHTTARDEPVCMQAREIKTEVEVTKKKCKVKTICDIWGLRDVRLGCGDYAMNPKPSATIRGSSALRKSSTANSFYIALSVVETHSSGMGTHLDFC